MVSVYVADPGGEGGSAGSEHPPSDGGNAPAPAWVAFSSHDYHGDDPDLVREGSRPVVFAGAGSHSGAFIAGDYVIKVDPPQVRALIGWLRKARRLLAPWRHYTGAEAGLGIPFVDYARGDGVAIGPGHEHEWSPVLIDDETSWVRDYRGLWGLDTRDRFGGERAPSGPRYERDGSVRMSWANPSAGPACSRSARRARRRAGPAGARRCAGAGTGRARRQDRRRPRRAARRAGPGPSAARAGIHPQAGRYPRGGPGPATLRDLCRG
jgi:hypothetical protein